MPDAIVIRDLSKKYRRYHRDRPQTLQEMVFKGFKTLGSADEFWALREANITIPTGRMVGMIGANGAGKSTLLRLIGGVGKPDRGQIEVNGRIGALLDLGAGFHPDLTGRENVFISGVISGLLRRDVEAQFDSIVKFAELEDFIDNPLRTYSSGMKMRLAFAVAVHIKPDILLIDEVLAVGDLAFQQKCFDRIKQFKEEGCTILLVSHDIDAVRRLCDEVIWLRRGKIVAHGPAEVVVDQYSNEMSTETARRTPTLQAPVTAANGESLKVNENRFGSLEMELIAVHILDSARQPTTTIRSGDALSVRLEYVAPEPIDAPIFGVSITTEEGLVCYDTSTAAAGVELSSVQGQGAITLNLDRLDLNGGQYFINVGAFERTWAYAYDYHWHVYPLTVTDINGEKGIIRPPHHWNLTDASAGKQSRRSGS